MLEMSRVDAAPNMHWQALQRRIVRRQHRTGFHGPRDSPNSGVLMVGGGATVCSDGLTQGGFVSVTAASPDTILRARRLQNNDSSQTLEIKVWIISRREPPPQATP